MSCGSKAFCDSINHNLINSVREVILLTILHPSGTIDKQRLLSSTGGFISPLNAEGNDNVVILFIDLVSLKNASMFESVGNSSTSSPLLIKLGFF